MFLFLNRSVVISQISYDYLLAFSMYL